MNDWSEATSITEFIGLFLNVDKIIVDNIISTLVYVTFIILVIKGGGIDWIAFIIIYLLISSILTILNISSFLNIVDIVTNLIESIVGQIIPDGEDIWGTIWSWINPFD